MDTVRDKDGNTWTPFVNEYQQRMLRCVAGLREGEELHDPRLVEGLTVRARDSGPKRDEFDAMADEGPNSAA